MGDRLDCDGVDDGAARGVFFLLVGVADGEGHDAGLGLEGPGVGVPAAAGVDRLDGELAGLGRVAGDGDGLQAQLLELKVTE